MDLVAAPMQELPYAQQAATFVYRERPFRRRLRRIADIALASALLVLSAPFLLLGVIAVYAEDGPPVLFKQRRAGRFERTFTIYKLRTMRKERCGDHESPSSSSDDRITRVGRFLRKTSIDELPQLFNVLRGDMSLIGPRPEMPLIINERYERWQHLRHLVQPGITGIWQATCRSTVPLDRPKATALDVDYIKRASPALDGELLLKTLLSVVLLKGAI
jgi:lipopolysaccharide/colanic/teichoic acid biosynthesis glycosyltransferase